MIGGLSRRQWVCPSVCLSVLSEYQVSMMSWMIPPSWRTLCRQTGWLTVFVVLLLCSSRLYVGLIKDFSASEEHAWRRHSPRGQGERGRGFDTIPVHLEAFPSPFPCLSPACSVLLLRAPPPSRFHPSGRLHCKTRAVAWRCGDVGGVGSSDVAALLCRS